MWLSFVPWLDSGKKTNEVNRSERRYTVDSVQCFSSKHWAVCPLLLAQPVDFRLSLISNQLKSFEFLRLNTSKFFDLVAGVGLAKSDLGR